MASRHLTDIESFAAGSAQFVENFLAFAGDAPGPAEAFETRDGRLAGTPTAGMLFLEPSTRTRSSFEVAAAKCGIASIRLDRDSSAMAKGESLAETAATCEALGLDYLVIRSADDDAAEIAAEAAGDNMTGMSVINAGSGIKAHPTQALGDALALRRRLGPDKNVLAGIKVGIAGDLQHSRVARSFATLVKLFPDAEVHFADPAGGTFMGREAADNINDLPAADLDALMVLRNQTERHADSSMTGPTAELNNRLAYDKFIKIDPAKFKDVLLMHPGPEVGERLPAGPNNIVREQVKAGVDVRIALFRHFEDA